MSETVELKQVEEMLEACEGVTRMGIDTWRFKDERTSFADMRSILTDYLRLRRSEGEQSATAAVGVNEQRRSGTAMKGTPAEQIEADANGHRTRFSDSSFYDEVCVLCGATDARDDKRLDRACPHAISPAPIVPEESEADETEMTWRDLALQFDGHRIEALALLRYVSEAKNREEAVGRVYEIKPFLSKAPLSGDQVLAARIAALAPKPPAPVEGEPVAYRVRMDRPFGGGWQLRQVLHAWEKWDMVEPLYHHPHTVAAVPEIDEAMVERAARALVIARAERRDARPNPPAPEEYQGLIERLRPLRTADEPIARAVVSADQAERLMTVESYLAANNSLKAEGATAITTLLSQVQELREALDKIALADEFAPATDLIRIAGAARRAASAIKVQP